VGVIAAVPLNPPPAILVVLNVVEPPLVFAAEVPMVYGTTAAGVKV
jgi:hypothetical protein